jgi:hypothetical protein
MCMLLSASIRKGSDPDSLSNVKRRFYRLCHSHDQIRKRAHVNGSHWSFRFLFSEKLPVNDC